MTFLCLIGLHSWEKDIPEERRDVIRSTGVHVAFFSTGIQRAEQHCLRCQKWRDVYRTGILSGIGSGVTGKWQRLSKKLDAEIERLPIL